MAVTDRAFSAVRLYGMEYHQSSQPFLQRTNTPGIVDASVSELGQINSLPMGSGLNSNGSYYMHSQLNTNPSNVGANSSLFLGVGAQNPTGIPVVSRTTCTSQSGRPRKHRLQEDNDCPLKKRRALASSTPIVFQESQAAGIFAGGSGQPFWASSHLQEKEAAAVPAVAEHSAAMMHPVSTEEMEEVAVETHSDVALRRIRDLESRLIVEDEDEEDGNNSTNSRLPILVMSDVLVEGLKRGLDESLTKKIVDSINRPSMELVLWKPQPEFLVNKLQNIASSSKTDKEATKKRTRATPSLQEANSSRVDKPCSSNVNCHIDTMWNREEEVEEMEL